MKERYVIFLVLVSFAAFAYSSTQTRWIYDCVNSKQCGSAQCCTIGTARFSLPHCRHYLKKGESCNPGGPVSVNKTYPDGTHIDYENVYLNSCPCDSNLVCSLMSGTCEDPFKE